MICKKCMHESYCDMAQFGGHNPPITGCCKFKERHQTNADRIRAMTDEELAEFEMEDGDCPPERMYPDSCPDCDRVTPKVCYDCWLDWLKQEAKE